MRSASGGSGRCLRSPAVASVAPLLRGAVVLTVAALLSGCVAFAALPVLAGGAMVAGGNVRIRAATPNPGATKLARRDVPPRTTSLQKTGGAPVGDFALTGLTSLPPPAITAPDPWSEFVDYALAQVAGETGQPPPLSALLVSGLSLDLPQRRECKVPDRAVIIDLDAEGSSSGAATPNRDLARQLERLRAAGIVVVWSSKRPASEVADVAASLRSAGLDPAGSDPLLLLRTPRDRKQALREEAALDVCPIAIAGDRKGDFDELFDYLRDPQAAAGLDSLLGSGWFIVPPPLPSTPQA